MHKTHNLNNTNKKISINIKKNWKNKATKKFVVVYWKGSKFKGDNLWLRIMMQKT